jgi:hypothetical protein
MTATSSEPHIQDLLDCFQDARSAGIEKWMATCPIHQDRRPSLSIGIGNKRRALVHCHAGCTTSAILGAVGKTLSALFPESERTSQKIVATYRYVDENSVHLYDVIRYMPKSFRQRRADGRWNMDGVPRVLYRLPELIASTGDVYIVGGEKDADNMRAEGYTATTNPGGEGKWGKLSSESELDGRDIVIIADKDQAGRAHAVDVAHRLKGRAASIKSMEMPGDGVKDFSDWLVVQRAAGLGDDAIRQSFASLVAVALPAETNKKLTVIIGKDEHRVADEVIEALKSDPHIYHRAAELVRVIGGVDLSDGIDRSPEAAIISSATIPFIREQITRVTNLVKFNKENECLFVHPPNWLPQAISSRGEWPLPKLTSISGIPVLRHDGSIHQDSGHDPLTGVLFVPAEEFERIPTDITQAMATAAVQRLYEVIQDFRFENANDHRAAWLTALLTPIGRHAFKGPSPLFLFDANIAGAGKGLCVQLIGQIALGYSVPVMGYAHDPVELSKRLTSIYRAGDSMVLLDNLNGPFGNEAIDRALTAPFWKDRLLGTNTTPAWPALTIFYATGNNVIIGADTARRVISIRLDVLEEHPEERIDFIHPNIVEWTRLNRSGLLNDALTILAGYIQAGRPDQNLKSFGSFEGWSSLIRSAVVWAGCADPCNSRKGISATSDSSFDTLRRLMDAFADYDQFNSGVVISAMIARLYPPDNRWAPSTPECIAMRSALEAMAGTAAGKPSVRAVGNRLKSYRRRVIGARFLDIDASGKDRAGATWKLFSSKAETTCESSESRESISIARTFFRDEEKKDLYGAGSEIDSPESPDSQGDTYETDERYAIQREVAPF